MCLRESPPSLGDGLIWLNTLVAITTSSRLVKSLSAVPKTSSLVPSRVQYTIFSATRNNWKPWLIYHDFNNDGIKDFSYIDSGNNPNMNRKTVFNEAPRGKQRGIKIPTAQVKSRSKLRGTNPERD